jgi:hypothetical protein
MTSVYNASLALKDAKNFKELLHVSSKSQYVLSKANMLIIAGTFTW